MAPVGRFCPAGVVEAWEIGHLVSRCDTGRAKTPTRQPAPAVTFLQMISLNERTNSVIQVSLFRTE